VVTETPLGNVGRLVAAPPLSGGDDGVRRFAEVAAGDDMSRSHTNFFVLVQPSSFHWNENIVRSIGTENVDRSIGTKMLFVCLFVDELSFKLQQDGWRRWSSPHSAPLPSANSQYNASWRLGHSKLLRE
jgi:hypothetical protein